MGHSSDASFFRTTDDFHFQSPGDDLVRIAFGDMAVKMTKYAAADLAQRLASYLVFLEKRPSEPLLLQELALEESLPENVTSLFASRLKRAAASGSTHDRS